MACRVTVIIPTWQGRDLVLECLRSLAKQSFRDFQTIVVDDGSTDNTADAISREFMSTTVVRLPRNRGFTAAVNVGIQLAKGEYVFLLNNDMTLDEDCLARLMRTAETTGAHMLTPLVLWKDEPRIIYAAGDRQCTNGRPESIGFQSPLEGSSFRDRVFGVTAGAGLYQKKVFDIIGLFDEQFNIYFSDSDISFRARLSGFEARFVQEAIAYHVGSASLGKSTLRRTRQCYLNHALLILKNMPRSLILRYAKDIMTERMHQTKRLFEGARCESGAFKATLTLLGAYLKLISLLPHALSERRRIQSNRVITVENLDALLTKWRSET